MSSLKKYPLFSAALGVCTLVVVGEGWLIYERWKTARETEAKLKAKTSELMNMATLAPAPTKDVAAAIEADLAKGLRALATMRAELSGHGPAAERMASAKVPAIRTDAFFDLATFVEKTRELAKKLEIDVRPEAARFGFATYANAAPEVDRIAPVFHQRQVAQYLLESLFEAKPRALLSVQRERTLTKTEREARDAAIAALNGAPIDGSTVLPGSAEPEGPDFFELNPGVSARAKDYLDTTAFKIAFTGQTASLRAFLNKLAGFELPVLVREVEVEPAPPEETAVVADEAAPATASVAASVVLSARPAAAKAVAAKPAAPAPIVTKPLSKFTVTVEYIVLVAPAAVAPEATAKTSED
jgi:hypothetical protein